MKEGDGVARAGGVDEGRLRRSQGAVVLFRVVQRLPVAGTVNNPF